MSEQSDKVADKILEQYGLGLEKPKIKEEADELPAPKSGGWKRKTKFTPDNTKRKTPYTPKPVTSARDWVHQFGEVQPHMYNKPFFDKACGDMKKMAKFDGIEATYSKEDWEYLVKMLSSQVADMIESAGFTYCGSKDTLLGMKRDIQRMLQTRFRATDVDGKQYDVKVEGNL